ncbi:MAG: hypothetical protein ACM3QU_13185 [Verrucomicrobiota bacterium]
MLAGGFGTLYRAVYHIRINIEQWRGLRVQATLRSEVDDLVTKGVMMFSLARTKRWALSRTSLCLGAAMVGIGLLAGAGVAADTAVPKNKDLPRITGAAQEGTVLTASEGKWKGQPTIGFSYQWRRCLSDGSSCVDVAQATDSIYPIRTADIGHTMRVNVIATNRDGSSVGTSAATAIVVAAPAQSPHNAAPPTISGSPVVGRVLTASTGTWTGPAPTDLSYQWRRCSRTGGTCVVTTTQGQAYTLKSSDAGRALRVLVTVRNAAGSASSLSSPTGQVAPSPLPHAPANTSPPRISGSAQQGNVLRGDRGAWTNSPTSYRYSWLRCVTAGGSCAAIRRATTMAYSLVLADVGHTIRFQVDAKNSGGTTRATSTPTVPVLASPPAVGKSAPTNISRPTISGTAKQGAVLTGDRGNWTGSPTSYDYTWKRCNQSGDNCSSIGGAHNTTYTLTSDDVGHTIRLEVEARNADGSTKATSSATNVVAASGPPQNTSSPTISGVPRQGETLTGSRGNWSGGVNDYDDSWLRCNKSGGNCSTIKNNAAGTTYVLTGNDVGHTIRFRVKAKNGSGSSTATSAPTAIIAAAVNAPVNTSPPTISGVAAVGQVLTMSTGKWNNSPTIYHYQWLRCDQNGGGCAAIPGAVGSTWRIQPTSAGHTLRGRVTASNSGGSAQATSVPTHVVAGAPTPPPPPAAGCPSGTGTVDVASIGSPARLLIDRQDASPSVVHRGTQELVVRYHVTACGGRPVQNALVYATAVPYNQWTIPAEQRTNRDGWAELHLRRLSGFPVSSNQQLIAIFVRARKAGENVLAGISTRRLFSVRVNLHA